MSFMEPQVVEGEWVRIEGPDGETHFIPWEHADLDSLFPTDGVYEVERLHGFGARLSAPGYMDCTDWSVHETAADAAQELIDAHYDQAPEDMTDDERTELAELEALVKA